MEYIAELTARHPALEECRTEVENAFSLMKECYEHSGKLLVCGNGGSAADAEHIVGELMKGFKLPRKLTPEMTAHLCAIDPEMGAELADGLQQTLMAISLVGHPGLSTAYLNDCHPVMGFAQQVYGFGREGDVLFAISTSGNSRNVIYAAITARALGMKVVGLTGSKESRLSALADVCIRVPETETFKIQELHLPVYHCLCLLLEQHFFA